MSGDDSGAIAITGIHLVSRGENRMEVCVEVNGKWVTVIKEYWVQDGVVSHIVEPLGIRTCIERARNERRH